MLKKVDPIILHTHQCLFYDDLPFWLELARKHNGAILELGCGGGRVISTLAKEGFHIFGIDRDFDMLTLLRGINNDSLNNQIRLIQADFTRFNLAHKFRLIIMPCNTYSTLPRSGRIGILKMVRRHLHADGLFAVQLTNPLLMASLPGTGEAEIEDIFDHPVTREAIQVASSWQRESDRLTVRWIYDVLSTDGKASRSELTITHYLEKPPTIRREFEQESMIIKSELGDYEYSSFMEKSPAWIILAGAR